MWHCRLRWKCDGVRPVSYTHLIRRECPKMSVHVSTQANICNYEDCLAWYELGASRVVLARELSFDDIRVIRERIPRELEIEAFVHGAMCMSHSGRCLLSNFMVGRDANRGNCAQPVSYTHLGRTILSASSVTTRKNN